MKMLAQLESWPGVVPDAVEISGGGEGILCDVLVDISEAKLLIASA